MFHRLCACVLLLLTALPFTAPFAPISIGDLLGGASQKHSATRIAAGVGADENDDAVAVPVTRSHFSQATEMVAVAVVASGPAADAASIAAAGSPASSRFAPVVTGAILRI